MAELDLNEKEDQWRQEKINSIKKLVDDNTIYGNSYAALDNIIAKAGNIMSDQGMIGRLQAQKDYKAFVNRVENDNTLPQDYKDYFLEKNKYDYKDKFDSKGNIIGGTKWTPTVSPTKIVPLDDIIVKGLKVMDLTSCALCKQNSIPITVFDFNLENSLVKILNNENVGTIVE